jgi:hypothetical protein
VHTLGKSSCLLWKNSGLLFGKLFWLKMVPRQLAFARQLDSFAHLMFNSLIIMLMLLIIIARALKEKKLRRASKLVTRVACTPNSTLSPLIV